MLKLVLIVAAALVISVAVASPIVELGLWHPGVLSYADERDIDWNKYIDWSKSNDVDNGNVNGAAKVTECGPSEEYKDFPGIKGWCQANCFHNPPYCPSSHCRCW